MKCVTFFSASILAQAPYSRGALHAGRFMTAGKYLPALSLLAQLVCQFPELLYTALLITFFSHEDVHALAVAWRTDALNLFVSSNAWDCDTQQTSSLFMPGKLSVRLTAGSGTGPPHRHRVLSRALLQIVG